MCIEAVSANVTCFFVQLGKCASYLTLWHNVQLAKQQLAVLTDSHASISLLKLMLLTWKLASCWNDAISKECNTFLYESGGVHIAIQSFHVLSL